MSKYDIDAIAARMEPGLPPMASWSPEVSIAISLKRIADELTGKSKSGFVDMADHQLERADQLATDLLDVLEALFTNEHVHPGDMVYTIRDREMMGWEGPSTVSWGAAVLAAEKLLVRAGRKAELVPATPPAPHAPDPSPVHPCPECGTTSDVTHKAGCSRDEIPF